MLSLDDDHKVCFGVHSFAPEAIRPSRYLGRAKGQARRWEIRLAVEHFSESMPRCPARR